MTGSSKVSFFFLLLRKTVETPLGWEVVSLPHFVPENRGWRRRCKVVSLSLAFFLESEQSRRSLVAVLLLCRLVDSLLGKHQLLYYLEGIRK